MTSAGASASAPSATKPEQQPTLAAAQSFPTPPEPNALTRSPVAVLTLPAISFQIDYESSAPREKAEATCAAEAKQDAQTNCIQKARDRFLPDVLRFKKTKDGRWLFTVYKSSGNELREVYVTTVELADASPNTASLKVVGREQGQRPLFKGRASAVLTVPNDYSLEIEDPQLGKLVYGAKVGFGDSPAR